MYKVIWYETAFGLNVKCVWTFDDFADFKAAVVERRDKGYEVSVETQ